MKYGLMALVFLVPGALGTYGFSKLEVMGYLKNDPAACLNCHVMESHYYSWHKGHHHSFATCNDCHASGGFFQSNWIKASSGISHSWALMTGGFEEPIKIKDSSRARVEKSCATCHGEFLKSSKSSYHNPSGKVSCTSCHSDVAHVKARNGGSKGD